MSAAPRTPAPHSTTRRTRFTADLEQIERYFAALPTSLPGCREIAIGKVRRDNPAKIDTYTPKPGWGEGQRFRWDSPETRAQLSEGIARLIEKHGNVYLSRALYQSPKRDAAVALPSRVLVFDDVTPNPIYSMLVETSPDNYQGYLFLSEDADAATIRELSERGAKRLAGTKDGHADTCYDVARLVRIPGSYNTKNGTHFQVRIASFTGKTYSIAEVHAMWPQVERKAPTAADLDWKEAELCYSILDGIEKRIGQHTLTYKQLHGDGGTDRSATRFALACNLRNKLGYPDEEITALLYKYHFGHLDEKGSAWLRDDILRCIAEANRRYPDIKTKPSYCRLSWQAKPAQPLPQVERPKTGRRRCLTDDAYLAALHQDAIGDKALGTQEERARKHGVSVPTIRRIEARLKQAGHGERRTVRKRGGTYSYFALFSAIKTPKTVDITEQQNAVLVRSPNSEEAQPHAENCKTQSVVGVTHPPDRAKPEVASPPRPSLGQAVNAMRQAGATRRRGAQNLYRMLDEHFPNHGWSPEAIDRVYAAQRRTESRQRSNEYWQRLQAMDVRELQRALVSVDRRIGLPAEQARRSREQNIAHRKNLLLMLDRKVADATQAARKGAALPPACLSGGVCLTSSLPGVLSGVSKGGVCQTMHADDPWLLEQCRQLAEAERHNDHARVTWLCWVVEGAWVEPSVSAQREAVHAVAQAAERSQGLSTAGHGGVNVRR